MLSCFKCVKNKKLQDSENVYVLDFSHHSLQDVPPEVFDYERTLYELNLGSNRIIDLPPQLFLCHELKILSLNNNDISTIPPAIGSLTNIAVLDLFRNNLTYTSIPDNIKQCKQLKHLNLSVNFLEKLPDSVTCLINLEELYLNDASLEFLQANFGRLTHLKILELRDNRLETLTKSLSRLILLSRIDLGHNKFTDFPEVLCSFENLNELILDENMIETLPDNLMNLKKLTYFDCSENDLIELPKQIQYLVKLQDLNLSGNKIENIPKTIGSLTNLVTLKLNNNNLNKIPDAFSDMKNLEELTLNDNFLTYIPPSIGQLRKLKFITLDNNFLEYLPAEISSCLSLSILSLRGNNLTELPTDIGRLINLIVLNIVNNNIRNLPMSILNLSKLTALWISDNQSLPMVQLQRDHDGDFNYFLTCYMLPQTKNNRFNDFSESADDLLNRQGEYVEKMHVEPKGRRICFSGEPAAQIDRPGKLLRSPTPYPKELRTMAKTLNDSKSNRFPTSELLFNEATPLKLPSSQIQIKEARISNNVSNLSANDEFLETSSLLHSNTQQHIHPTQHVHSSSPYNIPINPLEITQNMFVVTPNTEEFDSASSYCHSQMDLNVNKTDFDDMTSLNSSVSQDMILSNQHRRRYNNVYEPPNLRNLSPIYGNTYTKEALMRYENNTPSLPPAPLPRMPPPYHIAKNYSKVSPHEMIIYDSIRNQTTNSSNVYENTQNLKLSAIEETPQRYDEELSTIIEENSESDRRRNDSIGTENTSKGSEMEHIFEKDVEYIKTPSPPPLPAPPPKERYIEHDLIQSVKFNEENSKNEMLENNENVIHPNNVNVRENVIINIDSHNNIYYQQNIVNELNSTYHQIPNQQDLENNYHHPDQNFDIIDNSHELALDKEVYDLCDDHNKNNVQSIKNSPIEPYNYNETPPPPPLPLIPAQTNLRSPSKPWLFGKHKNPTVMQFSIRRNMNIGFNIKEIPDIGIFVNEIEQQCDAFEKLRRMDKILDIDGFDFTKNINFNEAKRILFNTGAIINIMISRT